MSKTVPEYINKTVHVFIFLAIPAAVISGFSLTPINLIIALLFLIFFIKQRDYDVLKQRPVIMLGVFLLWCLVSMAWSINPFESLKYWLRVSFILFSGVLVFAVMQKFLRSKDQDVIRNYILIAFVIGSIFFFAEVYFKAPVRQFMRGIINPDRVFPFTVNDFNKGVSFYSLCLWPAICAALLKEGSKIRKIVYLLLLAVLTFAVLNQLDSQATKLAVTVSSMIFVGIIITCAKLNRLIPYAVVGASIVLIVIAKNFTPEDIMNKYSHIQASAIHRLYIWEFSAEKAAEKPVLGWGMAMARKVPGGEEKFSIDGAFDNRERLPTHPHDSIIQIWLELGLVGLGIFFVFIYSLFNSINKQKNLISNAASHAMVVNYLIIGMLSFDIWRVWWLSSGVIAILFLVSVIGSGKSTKLRNG